MVARKDSPDAFPNKDKDKKRAEAGIGRAELEAMMRPQKSHGEMVKKVDSKKGKEGNTFDRATPSLVAYARDRKETQEAAIRDVNEFVELTKEGDAEVAEAIERAEAELGANEQERAKKQLGVSKEAEQAKKSTTDGILGLGIFRST